MSRTRANVLTAIVSGLICASLSMLPPLREAEQEIGLRWLFQLRGARPAPEDILLVAMNAQSAARIFLPRDPVRYHRCADLRVGSAPATHMALPELPARWPRCVHARLVDALAAAGARLIVFDVLFRPRAPGADAQADPNLYQDRALAAAIASAGNVLLADKMESPGDGSDSALALLSPEIRDAALGSAPFPVIPSTGRRIDRFSVFHEDAWSRPSLPMVALQAAKLHHYESLRALLAAAAPEAARFLPLTAEEVRAQRHLQSLTLHLHQLFRENPALGDAVITTMRNRPQAGVDSLLDAHTGNATRWLNFFGPSGTIANVDYDALLAPAYGTLPRSASPAAGKFVFVGYMERDRQEQMEHFATVYSTPDRPDLSGVEILATAFASLLRGESLKPAPRYVSVAVVFATAALAALAACALGLSWGAGASVLAAGAWSAVAVTAFTLDHRWLPVFVPSAMSFPLGFGIGMAASYLRAGRERARLRKVLAALVPREVADALDSNAGEMPPVRSTFRCVCVATDAAQFTRIAERMPTEALAELLNRYFGDLLGPVAARGGFVADIVGDAMVAVWRSDSTEARRQVCHALLEMANAVERFNANSRDSQLPTRFGAEAGQVTFGSLGAQERYEFRAVGDTVNTASRLQELNKRLGTRILVDRAVTEGLAEFLVRDVGRFRLRGKSLAVDVVELVGLRSNAAAQQIALCEQFGQAMQSFRSGRAADALRQFRALSAGHPGDGVTRFYLWALSSGSKRRDDAFIVR